MTGITSDDSYPLQKWAFPLVFDRWPVKIYMKFSQESLEPAEATRRNQGFSPESSERKCGPANTSTLGLGLQKSERIDLRYFKLPSLQGFVRAALGNEFNTNPSTGLLDHCSILLKIAIGTSFDTRHQKAPVTLHLVSWTSRKYGCSEDDQSTLAQKWVT